MRKVLFKNKNKLNKKGFTLVELLVSIAIMAVIALLLAEFVASSSGAYRRTSATTKIQEVCQDTLNQVSNIVRNSKSLKITKSDDGRITFQSVNYENKTVLLVYVPDVKENDYGRLYVDFDYVVPAPEPGEEVSMPDITVNKSGEKYNDYLITDMIKEFTVDFSTYVATDDEGKEYVETQDRTLDLKLTLEKNDREYTQKFKASLRNSSPDGQTTELIIYMDGSSVNNEESKDSEELE